MALTVDKEEAEKIEKTCELLISHLNYIEEWETKMFQVCGIVLPTLVREIDKASVACIMLDSFEASSINERLHCYNETRL